MTATAVEPGRVLRYTDLETLPPGTVIERSDGAGPAWTRTDGGFESPNGSVRSMATMQRRTQEREFRVSGMTPSPVGDQSADTTQQTPSIAPRDAVPLDQFKQLFRTTVMGAQQGSDVDRDPVIEALDGLKVPEFEPAVGMAACVYDYEFLGAMPENTLLATTLDPAAPNYGVYRKHASNSLTHLLGNPNGYNGYTTLYVVEMPGENTDPPWAGSESEPDKVLEFKAAAWKMAQVVKSKTGWCGEVYQAVRRCGVDASHTRNDSSGHNPEQVAALPSGTVLRYRHGESVDTALYVRDDTAENPAKTRRIAGTLPGSWAQSMVVVHSPGRTMRIDVVSHQELETMPLGTTIADGWYNEWVKVEQPQRQPVGHVWRHSRTDRPDPEEAQVLHYRADQFGMGALFYKVIP
jgi:hypothetical protein